jgi:hypothetical protein
MITIWVLHLTCIIVFLIGCSSHKSAGGPSHTTTRIVDITIGENSKSVILTVKGSGNLAYTAGKQADPLGLFIQFPATGLAFARNRFYPANNQFINVLRTGEVVENGTTTAIIFIGLKKDSPYDLVPVDKGLQVVFAAPPALSNGAEPNRETAGPTRPSTPNQKNTPAATILKTVTSKSIAGNIIIEVEADGAIINYKTFVIKNPARIVFDLYQVKSPYHSEKIVAVDSKWVRRIRYFGHPNKLRLVVDTHDEYLSNYASFPTPTGLFIQVGADAADASRPPHALE